MQNPFKFLDAYTKADRAIFFGRELEIEEMYQKVFDSKILLVYGISGTGKTSLIDCGLANKFEESDWLPVNVRRDVNITGSLWKELKKIAITPVGEEKERGMDGGTKGMREGEKEGGSEGGKERMGEGMGMGVRVSKALQSIYIDHFKPIYMIFDQFEELFIFGTREEREEFVQIVKAVIDSDVQCKFIFSIREEYLAGVTEFELTIPDFLSNRIRIEKMTHQHALEVIDGPCKVQGIEVEEGFAEALLDKLNPEGKEVELTYLQVFLDKVYKLELDEQRGGDSSPRLKSGLGMTQSLLGKVGDVSDLLGSFLEEQIGELEDPDTGLVVLKAFVSIHGTKKQIGEEEISEFAMTLGKPIDESDLKELLQNFVTLRLLRDKDENEKYELRHDSLAVKIYEKITLVEKELLEIKDFIENAYQNYKRRRIYLNEADLKYISPYEDKLFLNKKQNQFISDSRDILELARTRRRRILGITASAIIIVLSVLTIWAVVERSKATKALKEKEIAEEKLDEAAKNFVMSAENLNILYKGIQNPVSFAIPGWQGGQVRFDSDLPLSLDIDSNGMIIIPYTNGIANITLWRYIGEDTVKLGTRTFRVMDLPDPVVLINRMNSGYILRDDLAEISGLEIVIRDFNYDYEFEVIGYTISFSAGHSKLIYGVDGNVIRDELRNQFKQINHNSKINFTDIRVIGPDDLVRNLGSLTLTVVRWLDYGNKFVFYSLIEQAVQNSDWKTLNKLTTNNIKKYYWDMPDVLNNVAYEYYRLFEYYKLFDEINHLEALEWSARSVELDGDNPYYLDTYASLLFKFRRFDESELYIRKAIRIARELNEPTEEYENLLDKILMERSD